MKKNESDNIEVGFKNEVEISMTKNINQKVLTNKEKSKNKVNYKKINESDLILKNEDLKEEFLNEHNFTIEVDKKRKLKLETINSNGTNLNSNALYGDSSELENRRMLIEFVK